MLKRLAFILSVIAVAILLDCVLSNMGECAIVDNGDGTITDHYTGLMWIKDGVGPGSNNGNPMNWNEAKSFCNNLTFCNYDDWRLPSIKELISIVDFTKSAPAVNEGYFPNTAPNGYWTSSYIYHPPIPFVSPSWSEIIITDFNSGTTFTDSNQNAIYYVRPVRGPIEGFSNILHPSGLNGDPPEVCELGYTDNSDGTITDNCTGLMWVKGGTRTLLGTEPNYPLSPTPGKISWNNAVNLCNNLILCQDGTYLQEGTPEDILNHGGIKYSDWRLPTVAELTNVATASGSPVIPWESGYSYYYWTAEVFDSDKAWGVGEGYQYGKISPFSKTNRLYLQCVRDVIPENQPPNQPINMSPSNGAIGLPLAPILESSPFSDPDFGDTHIASQWQITTIPGDYSVSVFDSGVDTQNLTQVVVPSGKLEYGTTYYLHVRYQDSHGAWSEWSMETSFTTEKMPDFWISEIRPVQVVWDPDINGDGRIDLVAGKSTMVRVGVGMKNYGALNKQQLVEAQLIVPISEEPYSDTVYSVYKTIEQLEQNNKIDFYLSIPLSIGNHIITTRIDPKNEIKEANETNNQNSTGVTVKDTRGLFLAYIPVDRPITYFGYGPINMQRYSETVTQSGKFISATYPIAEGEFTNQRIDKKYYGDPVPNLGMIDDAVSIWTWGKLLTKALADKMVGIIPEGYFRYHRKENQTEDFRGIVFPGIPLALVEVGDWTSTAHEIYHTYSWGLGSIGSWARWAQPLGPGEEYETNPPDGNPASGFWVSEGKEVYPFNKETQKGSFCFMGSYATDDSFNYGLNPIWICKEDYITLFKEFRVDKTDPDVILVNGYISKDGTITLKKLYMVEEGKADDIMPGDYSIEVLDNTGQLLTEIPFYTSFYANADPIGTIEMDKAAFAFAIPYPDTTTKIQIQHNGETLVEFNSNSKLLHDAVDSIPDHGFINNTEQRRNALINKIRVVEKTIEEGNLNGAVNMLKFDIKDKFEKWLVDDYQVENPLQFTKDEVIILLDEIIQRLSLMSGRGGAPSPIEFPKETELLQNYPNPPNPETWIPFKLSEESDVTIEIHDVTGHLVRKLTLGYIPAGFYTSKDKAVHWDGKNEAGEKVASGIYFYTIKAGEFKAVRKMTITR